MEKEKKKIKIMHVAECAGGVDRYLRSLVKYIDHNKFENVMVLSQLYRQEDYMELADKVEIINMSHGIGIKALLSAKKVRNLIKQYEPDVVYGHSSIAGAITRLANIGLKSKCIYNPHGWCFNMQNRKKNLYILLEKMMAPFCEKIICISDAEKESALEKKICGNDKLKVIYNGIDLNETSSGNIKREDLKIPNEAFVVGMVGRICKQKATDIFVKMAGVIAKEKKNAYFIIVGNVLEGAEEERKKIEILAEKEKIRLQITGWVNDPIEYVKLFDVACLLSRWEGFGLAIPEYMLCRKPIVATNIDAIPNLIENRKNGILVDVDDYNAAANSVLELADDEELRSRLITNGINTVNKRFDVRRVSKELEKLVIELIET